MSAANELFGSSQQYPDPAAGDRFAALVGLDDEKNALLAEAQALIDPEIVTRWSAKHYGSEIAAVAAMNERSPLVVLAGDVGTGKTELAESIGHPIAVSLKLEIVTLFPLSLAARGRGMVGEMTTLISAAFAAVREKTPRRPANGRLRSASILFIDEADAIAQSREQSQMHHEDRAGVNALIRGIDELRRDRYPVLTILATNRLSSLDPAVLRRASHTVVLGRPDHQQITAVLNAAFDGTGIETADIEHLAARFTPTIQRPWGPTYSDLRQRFIPDVVLDAVRAANPLQLERAFELADRFVPTRPFTDQPDNNSASQPGHIEGAQQIGASQ